MPSPFRGSTLCHRELLSTGWSFCGVAPDAFSAPSDLSEDLNWLNATVPCTAASALRDLGQWSFDTQARRFDAEDWWFRCEFVTQPHDRRVVLGFEGLATLADVWLNGEQILSSENMFIAHEVDVTGRVSDNNSLIVRFRSLDKALTAKRPRPRWKAPMMENQQLRWFRTTVLGRTPGWSPAAAAVGPWRPVWIEFRDHIEIRDLRLRTSIEGNDGKLHLDLQHSPLTDTKIISAELVVSKNGQRFSQTLALEASSAHGELSVPGVERWWPHTHGEPALYSAQLMLKLESTDAQPMSHAIDLGNVGFRTVRVDTSNGGFRVLVNDVPIFCRGACWTPIDSISLNASAEAYARAVEQVREAGMNMIRIAGTTIYEDDALFDECDARGVLIWQEFMFANMDFPEDDERFRTLVEAEVCEQITRLRHHPAVGIFCGNSEVEQQAAMFGTTRERWSPPLFHSVIPALIAREAPEIFYWPSSAHGGSFPHQPSTGTTSYYGVGAYLRPIDDARRSDVKFATECLAFANPKIGDLESSQAIRPLLSQTQESVVAEINSERHTQQAFEYVRDFYLARLFGVDPRQMFEATRERYAHLAEAAAGEVMMQCFNEWRRPQSTCGGAIIWFWRDLVPGNGWGVISRDGTAKPVFYYLRRALQPLRIFMTDEGCNQPAVHIVNDAATRFSGKLILRAFRKDDAAPLAREMDLDVEPRTAITISTAAMLEWFVDVGYVFQFGPPTYDVLSAELTNAAGSVMTEVLLPLGLGAARGDPQLTATIDRSAATPLLILRAEKFAPCVRIASPDCVAEDNYFPMLPGSQREVRLLFRSGVRNTTLSIRDVNSSAALTLRLAESMGLASAVWNN
jgi:beta-mannosidase